MVSGVFRDRKQMEPGRVLLRGDAAKDVNVPGPCYVLLAIEKRRVMISDGLYTKDSYKKTV